MKALVVYESMFGNTEEVARAVADGLRERLEVEVVEVGDAPATSRRRSTWSSSADRPTRSR